MVDKWMFMIFFLIFCILDGDPDTTVYVRDSISLSFCFSFVPYWWVILCPGNLSGDLFSVTPPAPWFF